MDGLFIALLLLFFAQGPLGGRHPLARGIALLLMGALAAALNVALR